VTSPTGEAGEALAGHGRGLMRAGALLFLLGLFVGFGVPRFAVPRLALSTHLLAMMQATLLLALGLVWPRLAIGRRQSQVGLGLALYGFGGAWVANLLGALWGAGSSMLPMAAGAARGTAAQEAAIRVLLVSAALCQVALGLLVLWGLRGPARAKP
jgi:hydroxylaminobenzene mutase